MLNSLSSSNTEGVSEATVRDVVERLAAEAPEYSWTGYTVFGKQELTNKAIAALNDIRVACQSDGANKPSLST